MHRAKIAVALAAGLLLTAAAPAQLRRPGLRHRPGFARPYYYNPNGFYYGPRFGFGLGLGFGSTTRRTTYRNAFTGDVAYAEQASNDFRAVYERRK
jgi:hypothetical protein